VISRWLSSDFVRGIGELALASLSARRPPLVLGTNAMAEPETAAVARFDASTRALDGVGVAGTLMLDRPKYLSGVGALRI